MTQSSQKAAPRKASAKPAATGAKARRSKVVPISTARRKRSAATVIQLTADGKHEFRFNGSNYDHERDSKALTNQLYRIVAVMMDAKERTLGEIAERTGASEASVSAQLRHLRKERFGAHTVEKRHVGNRLFLYRLLLRQFPNAA